MALKSAPHYWVECDNCGKRCEYGDFSAWAQEIDAVDGAVDADWSASNTEPEKHHCPDCPRFCEAPKCGQTGEDHDDAGEYLCTEHHEAAAADAEAEARAS